MARRDLFGALMASEVFPIPPGPSMSAPQVRALGSKASAIFFNSPRAHRRRGGGEVVGSGGLAGDAVIIRAGSVVVCGFAFVECEALEDDCGGLFGVLSSKST